MKITVLMGGTSAERDVSLASGLRVAEALRARGHDVTTIDTVRGSLTEGEEQALLQGGVVKTLPPSHEALQRMARAALPATTRVLPSHGDADVIFLALHGGSGEDGTIQALLDLTGIPYTGSGHLASALAMDKDLSKQLFLANGVQTADWLMVTEHEAGHGSSGERFENIAPFSPSPAFFDHAVRTLGLPLIVKPSKQGSTVGLSMVKEVNALAGAVEEAFRHDDEVMIERFIAGRELTVGILGDRALPVGEIIPKKEIYDYECKYTAGMAEEIFPAKITDEQRERVQEQARRAFRALKLRGYARIDFRMTAAGEMYCLEANTLPGMTATSLIPQAAAAAGMDFPELCERIVRQALSDAGDSGSAGGAAP